MDWHSRYVLAWEVSVTQDEGFCLSALVHLGISHDASRQAARGFAW